MPADIPTNEPEQFRAGDTVQWKKSLDLYKADESWSITYSMRGVSGVIDITGTADGSDHLISISAATSSAYTAGIYDVVGYVEKDSERHTIFSSRIEVLPDIAAAGSSYDGRTHVARTLANIEATIESRASKEILESMIEGVQIKRIPHEDLLKLRSKYLQWYQQEQAAERIKLGKGSGRRILTRFE